VLSNPPPGTTLSGTTATFSWTSGTGADGYWLDVGTTVGLGNISAGVIATNFQTVSNLPVNGALVFVRLWTRISNIWRSLDYIYQTASEARFFRVVGPVATTITAFRPDGIMVWTNAPTNATFTVQTTSSLLSPINWVDYLQVPATNLITTQPLYDPNAPAGMALIPAGSFTMGDTFGDGGSFELPLHTVQVSALYMDKYEVTKALWEDVAQWAVAHGYTFEYGALAKANTHPAHTVTWYDAVKWCNARSEKEGRVPAYYTSLVQNNVYRSGQTNVQNDWVKWAAGYRLPTEAEWEKAARGGASGHRFPWPDTDQITHSRANYFSTTNYAYDVSATRGYHPSFSTGVSPSTSPVGYFAPNAYGLCDLAGNVWEWCWDWYGPYASGSQTDPRGPTSGTYRVNRGGSWLSFASDSRAANRYYFNPTGRGNHLGFRSVLPPSP
jgi:formylglycine-generating enzyme required for sulfatase activity